MTQAAKFRIGQRVLANDPLDFRCAAYGTITEVDWAGTDDYYYTVAMHESNELKTMCTSDLVSC